MASAEIRSRFLRFFEKRAHTIISSASLVTSDEKGVTNPTLFNTAGMQPLIPYLLGKPYEKEGKVITRLADAQKCLRTIDIDSIGDKTHATFFEMLGNWSLGDYFKKEAIAWSFDFLTSKEEGLGLDPSRLYVTVFEGDAVAPRDDEAVAIWREIFKKNNIVGADGDTLKGEQGRIFYLPAENNWWEAGENGPCGPDSEMFYDVPNRFAGRAITKAEYIQADDVRDIVEIWNDVFMQYVKENGKIIGKLPKQSVDTGAGLERLTMVLQGKDNIYDTDLLKPIIDVIDVADKSWNMDFGIPKEKRFDFDKHLRATRIIADHTRACVFMITDGIKPSNTDRGYVLRKLLRRAIFNCHQINLQLMPHNLVSTVAEKYKDVYPDLLKYKDKTSNIMADEEIKFLKTLNSGLKELQKMAGGIWSKENNGNVVESGGLEITGKNLFFIYSTHGFPFELSIEEINVLKKRYNLDLLSEVEIGKLKDEFDLEFNKHQELSRAGAEQKFKGGLADANNEMVVRYHTATHLLHQALFDVLGDKVMQKGSNITTERLRFDFAHSAKMTDEEKKRVEDIVNEKIMAKLPVNKVVMPLAEAEKTGAKHFFGEKYGDEVSIYFVGKDLASAYSKEFCGGPHVTNTFDLAGPEGKWHFKILKEEAVAQGIRRIKAVLQ